MSARVKLKSPIFYQEVVDLEVVDDTVQAPSCREKAINEQEV